MASISEGSGVQVRSIREARKDGNGQEIRGGCVFGFEEFEAGRGCVVGEAKGALRGRICADCGLMSWWLERVFGSVVQVWVYQDSEEAKGVLLVRSRETAYEHSLTHSDFAGSRSRMIGCSLMRSNGISREKRTARRRRQR
jgi:hypothetical protein